MAERPGVTAVISVDVCENFARLVIPRVADEMLGGSGSERVVATRGSFDDVSLPDGAVDFVVEIGAFHHADDLSGVVREAARVLRPGGILVCFDRALPDALTDGEVDRMLDRAYTADWLAENGYPVDEVLTRRENGEHEYRYFEWERAFEAADLNLERRLLFAEDLSARNALKGLTGFLPLVAQRAVVRRPVPTEYARAFLGRTAEPGARVGDLVVSDAGMHGFLLRKPG
ncbi:MAG: class I SAM-dependent methyltransferase [bacterium]|nr:class I SAM-dependent methyltransferase [bacterium]